MQHFHYWTSTAKKATTSDAQSMRSFEAFLSLGCTNNCCPAPMSTETAAEPLPAEACACMLLLLLLLLLDDDRAQVL
jgi:hypothetical protein